MKKNNLYKGNVEVELSYLLEKFYEKKFFILLTSIVCALLGCIYFFFSDKELKTEIFINKPSANIFYPYNNLGYISGVINVDEKFFFYYNRNFLSTNNLNNFINQSPEIKVFFDTRNINVYKYFNKEKLKQIKETKLGIEYLFFFPKELEGVLLLNNYAKYIMNKTVIEFKKDLEFGLISNISLIDSAIKIKKSSNQEFQKNLVDKTPQSNAVENLLSKEIKVLSLEIEFYKNILKNLENEKFNYNFIDQPEKESETAYKSIFVYFFSGLIVGFFLSLTFFFFRIF